MIEADFEQFASQVAVLATALNTSVDGPKVALWFKELNAYDLTIVLMAIHTAVTTTTEGGRMPTVATMRKHCEAAARAYRTEQERIQREAGRKALPEGVRPMTSELRDQIDDVYTKLRRGDVNAGLELTAPPGYLERAGIHAMRVRAKQWCRAHPDEARALPGWGDGVLDAILSADADEHRL